MTLHYEEGRKIIKWGAGKFSMSVRLEEEAMATQEATVMQSALQCFSSGAHEGCQGFQLFEQSALESNPVRRLILLED